MTIAQRIEALIVSGFYNHLGEKDITQAILKCLVEELPKDFEVFLREKHAEQYRGADDDMPDAYEDWLTNLDYEQYIDYANQCLSEIKGKLTGDK